MLLGPFCVCVSFWPNVCTNCTSYAVAEERRAPTRNHAPEALGSTDRVVGLQVALVELWVYLATAFDQIQRSHRSMSKALYTAVSN